MEVHVTGKLIHLTLHVSNPTVGQIVKFTCNFLVIMT